MPPTIAAKRLYNQAINAPNTTPVTPYNNGSTTTARAEQRTKRGTLIAIPSSDAAAEERDAGDHRPKDQPHCSVHGSEDLRNGPRTHSFQLHVVCAPSLIRRALLWRRILPQQR
jgi:hypothetical protein